MTLRNAFTVGRCRVAISQSERSVTQSPIHHACGFISWITSLLQWETDPQAKSISSRGHLSCFRVHRAFGLQKMGLIEVLLGFTTKLAATVRRPNLSGQPRASAARTAMMCSVEALKYNHQRGASSSAVVRLRCAWTLCQSTEEAGLFGLSS